jgi:hypothetical protein
MSDWPTCPKCHARRITRCPVCGTSGTDFPPADMDISSFLGLESQEAHGGCSCGAGGCAPAAEPQQEAAAADDPPAETPVPDMLMCPTCDEPFVPNHPRRCQWCGETFDDGWEEGDLPAPTDPINGRTVVVMLLVAAVLIGMVAYLMWLL